MSKTPKPYTPEEIHGVSQSQFSIARHYGGITFNGASYVYDPTNDSLIRADILKARNKQAKIEQKPKRDSNHPGTLAIIETE